MQDGTVVITRFGYGTRGDIVALAPSGEARVIAALDPARRRIGLTATPDGTLFDDWFAKGEGSERSGAVSQLSLTSPERDIISDLKKPVGVLAVGNDLFVSDQDAGQVLRASLSDPAERVVYAAVDKPDLLALGPERSLFVGSTTGTLHRIDSNAKVTAFAAGFQQVRGIAYDPTHRRLFVADHDADGSNGSHHAIRILPVD
jgi:hypothetical protein